MNLTKLRQAVLGFVSSLSSLGGAGLFVVAFLDSSFLTFPVINDFLVIDFSIKNPARMPYYALMSTLGSVFGAVVLYYLARKGGEAMFHRHAGPHALRIKAWVDRNGFVSVLVPALLPPPTPFKVFVIAAGVFEVSIRTFVLALLVARGLRYFLVGYLAIKYGQAAKEFLVRHASVVAVAIVGVVLVLYGLKTVLLRGGQAPKA